MILVSEGRRRPHATRRTDSRYAAMQQLAIDDPARNLLIDNNIVINACCGAAAQHHVL
jgi:hypothetical protein